MTKTEQAFVNEMTRVLLVGWCQRQIEVGPLQLPDETHGPNPFVTHAIEKGWLSKDKNKVLAVGFTTAAAFLRR